MKSVMEEGSSVSQAIEKAWSRAGKPNEFSVKIFELPEKNFIGITKKPAKIAIIFNESKQEPKRKRENTPTQPPRHKKPDTRETITPTNNQSAPTISQEKKAPKERQVWTDDMITQARDWMSKTAENISKGAPSFTTSVDRNNLRFEFNKPIFSDESRERSLFRSCAHLIMESLRNTHKKDFRHLKVVLNSKR